MSFVVAVPSYKRARLFLTKTYNVLEKASLLDKTTVFVVPEEEAEYRSLCAGVGIVVGKRGLVQQRQVIYDHYPEGTHILMLDDDIEGFIDIRNEKPTDILPIVLRGFKECEEAGARLWSIYPVANPFFMNPTVSRDLKFCCGWFFGLIKKGVSELPITVGDHKEDYHRTCAYWKADKVVIRINSIAAKQKFLRGDSLDANKETHRLCAEAVVKAFPGLATTYTRKSTGYAELRLSRRGMLFTTTTPT